MLCPICNKYALAFHIGDTEVVGITCFGAPETHCEYEPGTELFHAASKLYWLPIDHEQKTLELETNYHLDLRNLQKEYYKTLKEADEHLKVWALAFRKQVFGDQVEEEVEEDSSLNRIHCVPTPGVTCSKEANYNVWFIGTHGLYTGMCDEHTSDAVLNGVNGYRVYQITHIQTKDLR